MKHLASVSFTLAALVALGCTPYKRPRASAPPPPPPAPAVTVVVEDEPDLAPPPADPYAATRAGVECPIALAGTSVSYEDRDNGGALVFDFDGESDELRRRMITLADIHNRRFSSQGDVAMRGDVAPDLDADADLDVDLDADADLDVDLEGPDVAQGDADRERVYAGTGTTGTADLRLDIATRSRASLEETAGRIRLVFRADDDNVDALRTELRIHAADLSHACATD
jgi:hypothetical protein